jgi:hypothetical protein
MNSISENESSTPDLFETDWIKLERSDSLQRSKMRERPIAKYFLNLSGVSNRPIDLKSSSNRDWPSAETPKHFLQQAMAIIENQNAEPGIKTDFDRFLESFATNVKGQWLNELFNINYGNKHIMLSILQSISHSKFEEYQPNALTMVTAAIANKDEEVQEGAIRVLENWGTPDCLTHLKNVHVSTDWLQDYLNEVIADLESELSLDADT